MKWVRRCEPTMNKPYFPINSMTQAILNTYQAVPHAKADAPNITALVRHRGRVVGYRLSSGEIVSKETGVSMAKLGNIAGVGVGVRKGSEYLKALPDLNDGNNLASLPSIPIPPSGASR